MKNDTLSSDTDQLALEVLAMKRMIARALKNIENARSETNDSYVKAELLQATLTLRQAQE